MKKIYISFFSLILLSSCATRVRYVGSSFAPSQQVDVFVTKDAIKKPYDIVGKGYVRSATYFYSEEKVQKKAVDKARAKGAHAVLIEDYFVLRNDNSVTTTVTTDSSRRVAVGVGHLSEHPSVTSGMQIWFLRYK